MIGFLSYLVSSQKMQVASIMYGRKGHTHGVLGSLAEDLQFAIRYLSFISDPFLLASKTVNAY